VQVRSERDDYVLSDQIENLDYFVGHDPKAAEAFFGNAPPHRPSSTSYFSTIEFLCWRFQSTLGPYARIFSSKLTFVIDRYWRSFSDLGARSCEVRFTFMNNDQRCVTWFTAK
jgi:hypothetical protein